MATDRRAYVKIPDAILREPWDDATLADMIRLQVFLNTRWARDRLSAEEAGRVFLGPQEMMLITHTKNVTRARNRLLALAERSGGVTLDARSATVGRSKGVIIEWPKFPKEQGYYDRDRPKLGVISGQSRPPQTLPQTHKQEEKNKEPAAAAARRSRSRSDGNGKARKTAFPEPFPLDDRAALLVWAKSHGFNEQQVSMAVEAVADWAISNGKLKASWPRTIQGAMRAGWALTQREETHDQMLARISREMEETDRADT
jgi:hypothetical protein